MKKINFKICIDLDNTVLIKFNKVEGFFNTELSTPQRLEGFGFGFIFANDVEGIAHFNHDKKTIYLHELDYPIKKHFIEEDEAQKYVKDFLRDIHKCLLLEPDLYTFFHINYWYEFNLEQKKEHLWS